MAIIKVRCRYCQQAAVVKNGKAPNGLHSRRAKTVAVSYRPPSKGPVSHLVLDVTGLEVFGAGEWRQKISGLKKRRTWRKLHIAYRC